MLIFVLVALAISLTRTIIDLDTKEEELVYNFISFICKILVIVFISSTL